MKAESSVSITLPTVTYGSMLIHVKTTLDTEVDKEFSGLSAAELHLKAREITDKEIQDHKVVFDKVQKEFFSLQQSLR